jgi:hypothetical protein
VNRPSDEELATKRRECVQSLPTRRWRHKKSGKSYFVVDVVIATDPEAHLAFAYHSLEPESLDLPFTKAHDLFLERFEPEQVRATKHKENACHKV